MVGIGIIGCGNIAEKAYVPGCRHYQALDLVAVADLDVERARAFATTNEVAWGGSVDGLLAHDDVEAVLNLTIPAAHAAVDRACLEAGKHVFSEKPLAVTREEAAPVVALARERGLRLGCAPDTFLGAGLQRCRSLVDAGGIGKPLSATIMLACPGHESWHPDPAFYYQPGGGPLFDMGPYYLTALVSILGPVARVAAFTGAGFETREITSEPLRGTRVPVEVPTHVCGILAFANGVLANVVMSFDVQAHHLPQLELHGTEASLALPDPNGFGGPVLVARSRKDWQEVDLEHEQGRRGAGIADLCTAVARGRPHRASAELAFHVLDIMQSLHESGERGTFVSVSSPCQRPLAVPSGLAAGTFD